MKGKFFLVVILFALFASTFSLGKMALIYSPPLFLTAFRMLLASLFLFIYQLWRNPDALKLSRSQIFPIVKLALFHVFLTNLFEFWGLQYLSAVKTCFIYSLSPFITALFSFLFHKERLSRQQFGALCFGFIGMIPIFLYNGRGENLGGSLFLFSLPELSLVLATVFAVLGWMSLHSCVNRHQLSSIVANAWSMLLGGIFALWGSWAYEASWDFGIVSDLPSFLFWALGMLLVSNIICYNLYGYLLRSFRPTFMSFAGFIIPVFAMLFARFFMQEEITWHFFVSLSIIIPSLWAFYRLELEKGLYVGSNGSDSKIS